MNEIASRAHEIEIFFACPFGGSVVLLSGTLTQTLRQVDCGLNNSSTVKLVDQTDIQQSWLDTHCLSHVCRSLILSVVPTVVQQATR